MVRILRCERKDAGSVLARHPISLEFLGSSLTKSQKKLPPKEFITEGSVYAAEGQHIVRCVGYILHSHKFVNYKRMTRCVGGCLQNNLTWVRFPPYAPNIGDSNAIKL